MKKNKIIYWVTTGIISAMMLFSAYGYFNNPDIKAGFTHLGFPDYFRIELGIAKLAGALLLVIPVIPNTVKGLTYSGFAFTFLSAALAHAASGDPASAIITPLVFLAILTVSYAYHQKTKIKKPV
ncbi:MAG: DoxX family protein [Sediminibacterium sp.]